jgi:hypothetical protein
VGIETRKNGASYYYRKVRRNGRVYSEYVASGETGRLLHAMEQLRRLEQQAEQEGRRAQQQAECADERDAWALLGEAQRLVALAMLATGHYRHKGQWRRRRAPPMANTSPSQQLLATLTEQARAEQQHRQQARVALPELPAAADDSTEAVKAVMARCNRADATVEDVAALRAFIKRRPAVSGEGGPLTMALSTELETKFKFPLKRELLRDSLAGRQKALGYDDAPELERSLIEHLLLCELRLHNAEQRLTATDALQGATVVPADFAERALTAAQRRYLASVEALARVRRVRVELARVLPDGSAEAVAVEKPGA